MAGAMELPPESVAREPTSASKEPLAFGAVNAVHRVMRVVAGVVFRAGGYGAAVGIAPGCEGGALFNAFEQCAIAMKSKAKLLS